MTATIPASQGCSILTPDKEEAFRSFLEINLTIARNSDAPYIHYDLNCGCGQNLETGCDGSPLVFIRACMTTGKRDVRALFVDREPTACNALRARLSALRLPPTLAWDVRCEDNAQTLRNILSNPPGVTCGSIIADPNGHGRGTEGNGTDYRALAEVLAANHRLDVAINFNERLIRMMQGYNRRNQVEQFGPDEHPCIRDLMAMMNRRHWLIQCRAAAKRNVGGTWVLLMARNGPRSIGEHRAKHIYRVESPEGAELVRCVQEGRRFPCWLNGQLQLF